MPKGIYPRKSVNVRFFEKVNKTKNCWLWNGCRDNVGYGFFWMDGKLRSAHRTSYIIHKKEIPSGKVVMHLCDNPPCVNPDHLEAGTQSQNVLYAFQIKTNKKWRNNNVTRTDRYEQPV